MIPRQLAAGEEGQRGSRRRQPATLTETNAGPLERDPGRRRTAARAASLPESRPSRQRTSYEAPGVSFDVKAGRGRSSSKVVSRRKSFPVFSDEECSEECREEPSSPCRRGYRTSLSAASTAAAAATAIGMPESTQGPGGGRHPQPARETLGAYRGRRKLPSTSEGAAAHCQHWPRPPPPQPPGFVVHAVAVFRWLGVQDLTPEVLRRAKRGLREEEVSAKMWQALLRVALLYLEASRRRPNATPTTTMSPKPGPPVPVARAAAEGLAAAASAPVKATPPGDISRSGRVSAARRQPAARAFLAGGTGGPVSDGGRRRGGVIRADAGGAAGDGAAARGGGSGGNGVGGRRGAVEGERGVGAAAAAAVPVAVAMETCGHLLPLWGYRRSAFFEVVEACDALETREILLALSWLTAKARVFHAYEQACIVSPVPTRRSPMQQQQEHRQEQQGEWAQGEGKSAVEMNGEADYAHPPPFPRDLGETPDNMRLSRDAFVAFLRDEGLRQDQEGEMEGSQDQEKDGSCWAGAPPDWGGAGGKEEAVRMGEAGLKGRGLARALGASREMMCSYGRLEGELRVVEALERAREKMLLRMQHLHKEIDELEADHANPATPAAAAGGSASATKGLQQHQQQTSPPAAATSSTPSRTRSRAGSTRGLSPYCLCLLANRSAEELNSSLATVSRARAALEELDEGWVHAGRWCRWVSSALRGPSGVISGTGGSPAGDAAAAPAADGRAADTQDGGSDTAAGGVVTGTRGHAASPRASDPGCLLRRLARSRAMQEDLERRIGAAGGVAGSCGAPGLPDLLAAAGAELRRSKRGGDSVANSHEGVELESELVAALRRASREIDLRLGGMALMSALEEHRRRRQQHHHHQHLRLGHLELQDRRERQQTRDYQQQDCRQPSGWEALRPTASTGGVERSRLGGAVCEDQSCAEIRNAYAGTPPVSLLTPSGSNGTVEGLGLVGRTQLESSRRMHMKRLESLLSGCVGTMPLEPRGGGW